MPITFASKGDFSKTFKFLNRATNGLSLRVTLNKYGKLGVEALSKATPVDSGETAASWDYVISGQNGSYSISFTNSNLAKGWFPVALMLQYGHGTRNGGWVEGRDYINPAIQGVFDDLADSLWREVEGK